MQPHVQPKVMLQAQRMSEMQRHWYSQLEIPQLNGFSTRVSIQPASREIHAHGPIMQRIPRLGPTRYTRRNGRKTDGVLP